MGSPAWYKLFPSLSSPFQVPQSPRCGSPVWAQTLSPLPPLFPRISGGGPGSARGRTFFAKKGKDAAARATGTSGSDSRHEWVTAPPPHPQDSGAGAGGGGWPPMWGDGAERCPPPLTRRRTPGVRLLCGLWSGRAVPLSEAGAWALAARSGLRCPPALQGSPAASWGGGRRRRGGGAPGPAQPRDYMDGG